MTGYLVLFIFLIQTFWPMIRVWKVGGGGGAFHYSNWSPLCKKKTGWIKFLSFRQIGKVLQSYHSLSTLLFSTSIYTQLPITVYLYLYTNQNAVPALVHTLKTARLDEMPPIATPIFHLAPKNPCFYKTARACSISLTSRTFFTLLRF